MSRKDQLKQAIMNAFREAAQNAFTKSQETCPVKTGKLKKSGMFFDKGDNCGFTYTAPYATIVENGQSEKSVVVAPYYTSKGVRVRGYLATRPHREGKHFIKNAIESMKSEMAKRVDEIMRSNFKVR